jgi:hypothetical protein
VKISVAQGWRSCDGQGCVGPVLVSVVLHALTNGFPMLDARFYGVAPSLSLKYSPFCALVLYLLSSVTYLLL